MPVRFSAFVQAPRVTENASATRRRFLSMGIQFVKLAVASPFTDPLLVGWSGSDPFLISRLFSRPFLPNRRKSAP